MKKTETGKRGSGKFLSWFLFICLVGVGALYLYERYDKQEIKSQLVEFSNENELQKDSISDLKFELDESKVTERRLNSRLEYEQELYFNRESELKQSIIDKDRQISSLSYELDSLQLEKEKIDLLIRTGVDSLSIVQIDMLKKRLEVRESEIEETNKKLMQERKAKEYLSEQLFETNRKIKNSELFYKDVITMMVDVYDFFEKIDYEYYALAADIEKETEFLESNTASMGKAENGPDWLNIPAKNTYAGNPFMNDLYGRMDTYKNGLERAQSKIDKLKEILNSYDGPLSADNELASSLKQLIRRLEDKDKQIAEFDRRVKMRFIMVASTDDLKEMGILKRNDWRSKRYKRKIDRTQVNLNDFEIIDIEENTIIQLPEDVEFRSVVSEHSDWSYHWDDETKLFTILSPNEFWKVSDYIIIEIDND